MSGNGWRGSMERQQSDDELFVAVSMHNRVRLSRRMLCLNYTKSMNVLCPVAERFLTNGKEAISAWPGDLRLWRDN
ncbi:MAG: hypothetical protein ACLSUW_06820 [Akkermansia sp.]